MSLLRILALSSSRVGNSGYLEKALPVIETFLGNAAFNIGFVPFALVGDDYEAYVHSVRTGLSALKHSINLVTPDEAVSVIEKSDVIMVGGGNTFKLLHDLYNLGLLDCIRKKVATGTPYIGWSAGANITGPTIRTTNDMPVIEPQSFCSLGFLPFQINPHYHSIKIEGQNGETRDDRLKEFIMMNPAERVVALPEGSALIYQEGALTLVGEAGGFFFKMEGNKVEKREIDPGSDMSLLFDKVPSGQCP